MKTNSIKIGEEGSIQPSIDWVSTAILHLNKRVFLLKFSVPQEAK